ncbi:MAG: CRP-like cAMP-binding protein [Paraglaciecola psychrophila]|jgi:CRP-like cAMP-binding protein
MTFNEFAEEYGQRLTLEIGQYVFRQGDRNRSIYILAEGILKAYYISDEGKEMVKSFVFPGDIIGSLSSTHAEEASTFNLVALEPAVVVEIDFERLYNTSQDDLQLSMEVIDHLLDYGIEKERRERELLTQSAKARYQTLLEDSPKLLDKVKQKDIARYLGITPVALSRIRGRISK